MNVEEILVAGVPQYKVADLLEFQRKIGLSKDQMAITLGSCTKTFERLAKQPEKQLTFPQRCMLEHLKDRFLPVKR